MSSSGLDKPLNHDSSVVGRQYWVLAVLACCAAGIPILATGIPPLHDYPFHLARIDILSRHAHSDYLQAHYLLNFRLQPNLTGDILGVALAALLPIDLAGRALLASII
jgi:hypothetical protein